MSGIVSGDIIGGLGNHLFLIAFLLHYAKKTNKELVFKYEELLHDQFNQRRKTFWNTLFKNQFKVLSAPEYNTLQFDCTYHEQKDFTYVDVPIIPNNVLFKGYFQSFGFIDDDTRKQMIKYVYSNEELMYRAYNLYNDIKSFFGNDTSDDEMVSMHVRRTDFLWLAHFNQPLQKDYYQEALKIANRKKIVVFSDDIQWCKATIDKSWFPYDNIYFVNIPTTDDTTVELEFLLMSMFQHNIIANSTYSLWASFISTYQNPKIIVAPKIWLSAKTGKDCKEVYHKYITHII